MGAASERKKSPLSFADVVLPTEAPNGDVQGYNQLTFEALADKKEERTIDNCLITKQPTYKKGGDGTVWSCTVTYQQDLWHQEDLGTFVLHAAHHADRAHVLKLRVNDLIAVRGVPWTQDVTLRGGRVQYINHLNVTDIQVITRAPRAPIRRSR